MIKLKDVVSEYGEYEIDENKLKKLLIKPEPKSVYDLKIGDLYYYISSCHGVTHDIYCNTAFYANLLQMGNIFLTKEEAEFEVERKRCEGIMLKYGSRDMMSLGDSRVKKYYIYYDYLDDEIRTSYRNFGGVQGVIYFESTELCQKVINEIGEDNLKKYIFNVKE